MPPFHLAQLNIARAVTPLEAPEMADFFAQLDAVNALADAAPGFIWRLQTEDGNATAIRPYGDDRLIVNMSVWETPEALHDYVFKGGHLEVLRRRREWFSRLTEAYAVLWWVPAGHRPTVEEAVARLDTLRSAGPSPTAFTFSGLHPPPADDDADGTGATRELADGCPAT